MAVGLVLGFFAWVSLMLSWHNLPLFIKIFLAKNPLLSDVIAVVLTYTFISTISGSLSGVIATVSAGVLVNLTTMIGAKSFIERHPPIKRTASSRNK